MNKWGIDSSWTLFLDRDGVINVRIFGDYIKHPDEFKFLEQVQNAIPEFNQLFGKVLVATNQQGIAKGVMTERNLSEVHHYMLDEVEKAGGKIHAVYFAPELASETNFLRKPNPGMALKAKEEFPEIDFSRSVMVGDSDSDMIFGRNLGMKTVRVVTEEPVGTDADLSVSSLMEFAEWLKK